MQKSVFSKLRSIISRRVLMLVSLSALFFVAIGAHLFYSDTTRPGDSVEDFEKMWSNYREKMGAFYGRKVYGKSDETLSVLENNERDFLRIEEITQYKYLPKTQNDNWWSHWTKQRFIWWGVRSILIETNKKPVLYTISYYNKPFTKELPFISRIDIKTGEQKKIQVSGDSFINDLQDGNYTPFSALSAGQYFILGHRIVSDQSLNSANFNYEKGILVAGEQNNGEALMWMKSPSVLSKLDHGLRIQSLVSEDFHDIEIESFENDSGHVGYPKNKKWGVLPDIDGDGDNEVFIKYVNRIEIFWSANLFKQKSQLLGSYVEQSQIGSVGDFDGDGLLDFWLAIRPHHTDGKIGGEAYLFLGKNLTGDMSLDDAECKLTGALKYTDTDPLGATISPIAGDMTGDGKPDFTISGHFHMSWSGALYILPSQNLRLTNCDISTDNENVIKILGEDFSELGPPGYHYDHLDVNSDGFDDLIIGADNDMEAGFASGAIVVIDGQKMTNAAKLD